MVALQAGIYHASHTDVITNAKLRDFALADSMQELLEYQNSSILRESLECPNFFKMNLEMISELAESNMTRISLLSYSSTRIIQLQPRLLPVCLTTPANSWPGTQGYSGSPNLVLKRGGERFFRYSATIDANGSR